MRFGEFTDSEFDAMVEEGMENAIDKVASRAEWESCKRAIARWVAQQDAEVDEAFGALASPRTDPTDGAT